MNLSAAGPSGVISLDLKPGYRDKLTDQIDLILSQNRLSPGMAAKLRGRFGWAATATYGRCGRCGLAALQARQQSEDSSHILDAALRDCLAFHRTLATFVQPRLVPLLPSRDGLVRVYSDDSYEPESAIPARLGFVVFPADGAQPKGFSADIGEDILDRFQVRKTQIVPCEALLGVVVPANCSDFLAGRDVIWYVDSQPACQLLMKGSSSVPDLCIIAALTQLLLARMGSRVYWEWVESDANASDGLSRAGLHDAWSLQQGWLLAPVHLPDILHTGFESLAEAVRLT